MTYQDLPEGEIPAGCYAPAHWLIAHGKAPLPDPISDLVGDGLSFSDIKAYMEDGYSIDEIAAMAKDCKRMGASLTDPELESTETGPQMLNIISAPDLQRADLPPVKYLVEGILPDGTSLLTAASKIGKSWMVLDLGLCQASGAPFMGHKTNQCGVLYLALEDSLNRLQKRMKKILKGKEAPPQFYFTTEAPKLDNGLLDTLDAHLRQYPDTKLIIIDTLQKVRGQSLPRESGYAQDYREMETIKACWMPLPTSVISPTTVHLFSAAQRHRYSF